MMCEYQAEFIGSHLLRSIYLTYIKPQGPVSFYFYFKMFELSQTFDQDMNFQISDSQKG